jgi:hypothetical protein
MSCDNVNCNYSAWVKLPCLNNDKLIKLRTINTPSQGTNGSACDTNQNNYIDTETCILPKNCELSDWSGWSPCSSGKQIKTRTVQNSPKIGGDVCPESLTAYFETQNCTANNTTTGTCTYTDWSDWSPCTTVAGIGYQVRTRGVQTAGGNCSNKYEDYVQKQTCNNNVNNNCVLSDWSWSPCSTKCGTGFKIGTRKILENAKNGGTLCPMDIGSYYMKQECTSNEYCPVDCITVADWGACINNVSTRNITPAQKCGQCPQGTETTRTCNNCTVSWSACDGTKQTKIVTQATNGTACTPAQNAPENRSCTNCTVSGWSECKNGQTTRTVTQAVNGTICTEEQNIKTSSCGATLTAPPVKGIAGGNGYAVGDVNNCGYGCLWFGCSGGGHKKRYKMGIRYINQPATTVYNNYIILDLNEEYWACSNMLFFFSNAYTNPPGTEIIVAEAPLNTENWRVARTGIQLVNQSTYRDDGFR